MALISRRRLLAGAAGVTVIPRHHKRRRRMGMQPDQSGVFFQLIIVGGGEFTYDALGNLRTANVGQTTTDPLQGITCYAGFSTFNGHGAVISLFSSTLDAQLWYTDTGSSSQGVLMSSVAAAAGTDPFGNAFLQGISVYVFSGPLGLFIETVANAITFGSSAAATRITNAGQIFVNDALTDPTAPQLGFSAPGTTAGPRASVQMTGESKDTTAPAQMVVGTSPADASAAVTTDLLEVHGSVAVVSSPGKGVNFLVPSGVAATDTAAIAATLSLGSTPVLLPGTWNINCGDATLTALGPGQYIIGCGDLNTIINAHGTGDVFRWFHTGSISDGTTTGGGFIGGATIDGSACSGAATGIHAGDINALRFDVRCQHFNQTGGSWGFFFENRNFFTERMHINIRAKDCGFAGSDGGMVGFNVGGATTSTGSFARLKGRIEITQGSNQQDGVVLEGGAHIYDYDLEIVGNFQAGASATTAAALRLTGTVPVGHPGAGTHSAISNGRLNIGLECSSGANAPTDFVQASTSNSVTDSYGNINWNQNFTSSGITGAGFKFGGLVQGDTAMGTRLYYGTAPTQTITANGQTINAIVPSAKIPISAGAPGFTGIILSPGDVDGQLIYLIGTGTNNITFAAAVTSNVALGTGASLVAGGMMALIWDAGTALWYPAI